MPSYFKSDGADNPRIAVDGSVGIGECTFDAGHCTSHTQSYPGPHQKPSQIVGCGCTHASLLALPASAEHGVASRQRAEAGQLPGQQSALPSSPNSVHPRNHRCRFSIVQYTNNTIQHRIYT